MSGIKSMDAQQITSAIEELKLPFYRDWGFWISTILGLVGILFSVAAFAEARKAKKEAGKAADAVRKQAAVLDIAEITRTCQIKEEISYPEASLVINEVTAKVKVILGVYRVRLAGENQILIQQVEAALQNTRAALDRINPLTEGETRSSHDNVVYYTLEPQIASMVATLNELKGTLDTLKALTN